MPSTVQVIGREFEFNFGELGVYRLHFVDETHIKITIVSDAHFAIVKDASSLSEEGGGYPAGHVDTFEVERTEIRPDVYIVGWREPARTLGKIVDGGKTVVHVEDFANNIAYTSFTDIATSTFRKHTGTIKPVS